MKATIDEDLTSVLERLLAASPGADAFHLRLVDDFSHRAVGPEETDAIFASFLADFEDAVARVGADWGAPTFRGGVDRDDFPPWSEALVLAYWQRGDAVAFLSLRHDDEGEPMFLEVGALTDDEAATLAYTRS
ncbi:MAG: hypothetical protein OEP45_05260 [Acidobacteriota bacterium]|nr:hypothetical protein [Acidobacteriota bacterium]